MDFHGFPVLSLSSLSATTLAILLFLFLYNFHRKRTKRNTAPEASGAWPVLGHLPLLGGSDPPHVTLGKMADEHGPIFTIRMGVHKALVVSSWEIAKDCFTANDKAFSNRPKAVALEIMAYNYAMFGFSPYGAYWRQLRRIATIELLSSHRLLSLESVREEEVSSAVRDIYQRWTEDARVSVDVKKWFAELTLNVTLRMIVGKRSDGGDGLRLALREFFRLTGVFVVADAVPWLRWLDFGGHEKAMKKTAAELDGFLEELLEEHKEKKRSESEDDHHVKRDFMGVMLSILDAAEEASSYDADTINKATCLSLILGGSDTTLVTLTWALALLLNNKPALTKTLRELDEQVGRERQVNDSDIANLVYLQAVLKESLRLHPAAGIIPPREATEDCTVAGFDVPAGTRLFVNASKIQRDPRVWSDPEEFRPERFLKSGECKSTDFRGQSFELIPFGAGRRICPGISFALQVTSLVLASLLHGFEISTVSGEPIVMFGKSNLLDSPIDVLVAPRLPAHAYR